MAETCIVCLGDLAPHEQGPDTATEDPPPIANSLEHDEGVDSSTRPSRLRQLVAASEAPAHGDESLVAHLLPCGHNLHNECLKPWVERANSCPICRASFNMVELCIKVGGPMISSYAVQDRQQVPDIDPSMIVEDDYLLEDDGSYDACMVCDEFGNSSQLMFCHSCEQLCHVFCAGLDRMPSRGAWYCQGCVENPELLTAAARRGAPRNPAAYVNGRSRLRRRQGAPDEWVGVWQSVWDRLHFDLEFPFEDDDQSTENRSEVQRRDQEEWGRRFAVASRVGAGNRFRAAADNVHVRQPPANRSRPANPVLHREAPKTPRDPESQEELRAWNQFEKAREQVEQLDGPSTATDDTNTRRRKRKSIDSSQGEPESRDGQEPVRKLKRPRTRLNLGNGEPSSVAMSAAAHPIPVQETAQQPTEAAQSETKDDGETSAAPGFLQSLLKEVEVDRFAEREKEIVAPQPRRIIVERACSPQNLSPGLSPIYQAPLGIATPPPLNLRRSSSPHSADEALHSPTYSPYSPAESRARQDRRNLPFRSQGLSSPPRSKDSSPTRSSLSYSTKAELQRMVTAVLKPFYTKKQISKSSYTDINRDVSRLLYDRVGDAGAEALANQQTRLGWQKMASEEVDKAVKALQGFAPGAATVSVTDDSASSSS